MQPKTKIQTEVAALSAALPPISEEHKLWAYDNCLDKYVVRSRNTLYCLECGHRWKDKSYLITALTGCTCPSCGHELKCTTTYHAGFKEAAYFAVITAKGDKQVVRMIFTQKNMKKGLQAETFAEEVMQHWIYPTGKVVTLSKSVMGFSIYYDQWIFGSELEVRLKTYRSCRRYDIPPYKVHPDRRIAPVVKRNGFKGRFYGIAPHRVFSLILTDSFAETLLKSGQPGFFSYYAERPDTVRQNWPTIKICIRNRYKVKDASIYFDYLGLLRYFGRDLHSPKYVCPANLKEEHDRLMKKKRDIERRREAERRKAEMEKSQVKYAKEKGAFFGMVFTDGSISIKPLESVLEFMQEGDALNHCVFTSEYYKRRDSLLLSARIKNKPVETIEVSLRTLDVLQARGMNNNPTKYHNRILSVVKENKAEIQKRLKKTRKYEGAA